MGDVHILTTTQNPKQTNKPYTCLIRPQIRVRASLLHQFRLEGKPDLPCRHLPHSKTLPSPFSKPFHLLTDFPKGAKCINFTIHRITDFGRVLSYRLSTKFLGY